MKKDYISKKFTVKQTQENNKDKRLAIILGLLTLGVIAIFVVWGVPLIIKLTSYLGNMQEEVEVVGDQIPPVPPQFAAVPEATNTATIDVSGFSEPNSEVEVFLNDSSLADTVADEEGEFEVEKVSLTDGTNALYAIARDEAGNQSNLSKEITVVLDTQAPELNIETPQDGSTVYEQRIEIKGQTDSEDIRVTVNDHLVVVEKEGKFNYFFELAEGANEIKIVAQDLAGNKIEKTLVVSYVI